VAFDRLPQGLLILYGLFAQLSLPEYPADKTLNSAHDGKDSDYVCKKVVLLTKLLQYLSAFPVSTAIRYGRL